MLLISATQLIGSRRTVITEPESISPDQSDIVPLEELNDISDEETKKEKTKRVILRSEIR